MRQYFSELRNFFRKGDMWLLGFCLVASGFGCLMITSATQYTGNLRHLYIQLLAIGIGVLVYILISSFDVAAICEHPVLLTLFSWGMILLLKTPYGVEGGTGNRSWLDFPFLPVMIQPAEFVKIAFVLLLASIMGKYQNKVSGFRSMIQVIFHTGVLFLLNMWASDDLGVSLFFAVIFLGMTFAGGVHAGWFGFMGAAALVAVPVLWQKMDAYQRNRILIIFDETIDPLGLKERYHTLHSLRSLTGGGLIGQGLFRGHRTQAGILYAQHTDFIFSAIGEETGCIGCLLVLALLSAIIIRCIIVGNKSPDYMRKVICYGVASSLIFQTVLNVGMCMGVLPIVGLTLPFISYGGSSIVSLFAMVGLVSGIKARPQRPVHERYVYAPIGLDIKENRLKKRA